MAKVPKKAWNKKGQDNLPALKDDGTRWLVVRDGEIIYPSVNGSIKQEAIRLAQTLREPAEIRQIK